MGEKNKKQQIIVKICCVLAAFGLWLYTTSELNPISTYKKTIPVTIVNEGSLNKSKLTLVANQNFHVTLNIKGHINDIYSVKEGQFKVVLNLEEYVLKKGENNIPVHIEKSPSNIKITNSDNLWVKVNLDELVGKKLSLKVIKKGKAKEGYYPLNINTNVKKVLVKGPSKYVNAAHAAQVYVDINGVNRDLEQECPIKIVNDSGEVINQLKASPNVAKVTIPIRKIKTVNINVKTIGKLKDAKEIDSMTTLPEKVSIVGNKVLVDNIKSIDTEPIDLANVINGEMTAKLNVPSGITLVNNNGYVKVRLKLNKPDTNDMVSKKEFSIPIKTVNLGDNYVANLDNSKILLLVSGDNKIFDNFNVNNIKCYVDLKSLQEGGYKLPVKIDLPNGITLVSISPEQVTVNIKKNQMMEEEYVNTNK